ncbi:MAG: P-II family nitrogen regulator [Bacillota bacterium]|nr:P-II family nitrogen regulator [Bacillota bacterium]
MDSNLKHDLIVTIVKKGCCEKIITATKTAGAEGATIIPARGTGIHEQKKLLGIPIEPEKDIIFTIIQEEKTDDVLKAIIKAGKLEKPGTGIAFVLELKKVVGVVHLVRELKNYEKDVRKK